MISCAFPPVGGPGVQRSAKFAKYLPRYGWLPTVWAAEHIPGLPEDRSLLADLPGDVTIYRRPCGGRHSARHRLANLAGGRGLVARWAQATHWRILARAAHANTLDEYAVWTRTSARPLRQLVKRGVDAVYSTFSPPANHLLALDLKRRYDLPWIADFRDLWTDDPRYRVDSDCCRDAHRQAQQEILEAADLVVAVTESQAEILSRQVPDQPGKFLTITNGFDPDDFAKVESLRRDGDRFILAHVGRLDHWRAGEEFFAGLTRFLGRLNEARPRVTLRVVGHATDETMRRLQQTGIEHSFSGYVPHAEAIREMVSADALLLLAGHRHPHDRTILTGKIFEYLASERPILFVGPPDGEPVRLIQQCQAGLTAAPEAGAIADTLDRLYRSWEAGEPMRGCDARRRAPFSRVALASRLANHLNALLESRALSRPKAAQAGENTLPSPC